MIAKCHAWPIINRFERRWGGRLSLVVEDKKLKLKDNSELKEIIINIHYTGSYSSIAKENNL